MTENTGDYFVLRLSQVSDRAEDWLSEQAFRHGALGISEALNFSQPEGEEDVFVSSLAQRSLDIYFDQLPSRDFIGQIESTFPEMTKQIVGEKHKDWLAEWKKGFVPFALTGDHWVVPSWCEPPEQALHAVRIDPGMAFGTGTHETTRLVARELSDIGKHHTLRHSLLDVGTGTGILAILAYQMGYGEVAATEIEEDSRRVARENFQLNGATVKMDANQVEQLEPQYDVVVANIIDGVLVRIQDALKARVKPGGWLLLSGIILEREPDFLKGFNLPADKTWQRRQSGDWLLYSVRL